MTALSRLPDPNDVEASLARAQAGVLDRQRLDGGWQGVNRAGPMFTSVNDTVCVEPEATVTS